MNIDPRWEEIDDKLTATVTTADFLAAVTLLSEIAALAEEQNHHPDIAIHDFNKITITLTSHDEGAITDRDYKLADAIDALLDDDEFELV